MKKLVILSPADIEYVLSISKKLSDTRSIKGNFSKGLAHIIEFYRCYHLSRKIKPIILEK